MHSQERLTARTSITQRSTKCTKAHQEWVGMSECPNEIKYSLTLRGLGIKNVNTRKPGSVAQDPDLDSSSCRFVFFVDVFPIADLIDL